MQTLLALCICLSFQRSGAIYSVSIYGNIDHYAYYFVDLLVGKPPQRVSAVLDLGAELTAFPCNICKHCGSHIDPVVSIQPNMFESCQFCSSTCQGGHCSYHQGYEEGSQLSGWYFHEDVCLEGDNSWRRNFSLGCQSPPVSARMGCHVSESKLFYTQAASGIFGMLGKNTVLQQLLSDHKAVGKRVLSLCLAEWGGRLTLGGDNAQYHISGVRTKVYVQFDMDRSVQLQRVVHMKVGEATITGFGSGKTEIDPGTTYTYMAHSAYQHLKQAIEHYCAHHANCQAKKLGKCWKAENSLLPVPHAFPTLYVLFGSVEVPWEPRAYMHRKGLSNLWCYAFEDDGPHAKTTLGASWMIHKDITFDFESMLLGFATANCPEHRTRPEAFVQNNLQTTTELSSHPSSVPFTTTKSMHFVPGYIKYGNHFVTVDACAFACGTHLNEATCTTEAKLSCDYDPQCTAFATRTSGKKGEGSTYIVWNRAPCAHRNEYIDNHWDLYQKHYTSPVFKAHLTTTDSIAWPVQERLTTTYSPAWTAHNAVATKTLEGGMPHPVDTAMQLLDEALQDNRMTIQNMSENLLGTISKALMPQRPRYIRQDAPVPQASASDLQGSTYASKDDASGGSLAANVPRTSPQRQHRVRMHDSSGEPFVPHASKQQGFHVPRILLPWLISAVASCVACVCAGLAVGALFAARLTRHDERELRTSLLECDDALASDAVRPSGNTRGHQDQELGDLVAQESGHILSTSGATSQ